MIIHYQAVKHFGDEIYKWLIQTSTTSCGKVGKVVPR